MSGTANSNTVGPVIASAVPPPTPPPPQDSPPFVPPVSGSGPGLTGGCGLPGRRFFESYFWRFVIANLNCETITMLDRLASNRHITKTLGDAMESGLSAPSDNIRVNLPYTDGDPKLDEGTRILFGFRHEGTGVWQCRSSGIIMQAHDFQDGDTVMTDITAWDPWRYLDFLPIINPEQIVDPTVSLQGVKYWSSTYSGKPKPSNVADWTVDQVIINQLTLAEFYYNPLFIDYGQTFNGVTYHNPIPNGPVVFPNGIQGIGFANGQSVGQALRDCIPDSGRGYCDIVLQPVYDPENRPGIISELSIYPRVDPSTGKISNGFGAGTQKNNVIMSWDRTPSTLSAIDRLQDGTQRANNIQNYHSRGGPPVPLKLDPVSLAKYKAYFHTQFFPIQGGQVEELEDLATAALLFRQSGVETLTMTPTPERAKVALLDFDIGDTVQVFSSVNMRKPIFSYYRVHQIPIQITDEALESVQAMTVKKAGDIPPPLLGPEVALVTKVINKPTSAARRTTITSLPGP